MVPPQGNKQENEPHRSLLRRGLAAILAMCRLLFGGRGAARHRRGLPCYYVE